jgi:MraZ protein
MGQVAAEFNLEAGGGMTVFLASHLNGVDKKGRVSVPAPFRHEMAAHARQTVVVYVAPEGGYVYGWAYEDFLKLAAHIQRMPPLSPTRGRLARAILAAARPLGFDDTGRIMLPDDVLVAAGITDKALFAGQGEYFTIWNPDKFSAQQTADSAFTDSDLAELSKAWDNI